MNARSDTVVAMYTHLTVDLAAQTLQAETAQGASDIYPVSTAAAGAGQTSGSLQTPLGRHEIRAKIGHNAPRGAVFVGRRATGELWSPELHRRHAARDWILTRILWLRGCEPGHNRAGDVDTLARYIYIHGTPDVTPLGTPGSHGCIRMRNEDIETLFERVAVGTLIDILARGPARAADAQGVRDT